MPIISIVRRLFLNAGRVRDGQVRNRAFQVSGCHRKATITESPVFDVKGNWQLRVERYASGENIACAVAIDLDEPRAIIITAFWVK